MPLETRPNWPDIAACAADWAHEQSVDLRAAVVLVPFAQQLPAARRAWALRGGWQPRIETTQTLAAAIAPAPAVGDGQVTLDASVDRLTAAGLLRSQSWVSKEPVAFDEAVSAVVTTAQALLKAVAGVAPQDRASHWQRGREILGASAGPGSIERGLARLALEWASAAPDRPTDAVFDVRPSAWIIVRAGGHDVLAQCLATEPPGQAPALVIDTDSLAGGLHSASISLATCDGFEDEAECATAQILVHLRQQQSPVALVAQDRALVRRMRAMLERQGVSVLDETGWKLSTTRAAAQIMSLLRVASPIASTDLLLDWLKSGAWPQRASACNELETSCRRAAWNQLAAIDTARLGDTAALLVADARSLLAALVAERHRPLSAWLGTLHLALCDSGVLDALRADTAGVQVLQALRLDEPASWLGRAAQSMMQLDDFVAWVDSTLEDASFVPASPGDAADVVITPLSRVMLRPFAAVVFPGADDHHLGATPSPLPLLSDAQAAALGIPASAQRREAESLAFAHATCSAPVALFHRRSEGAEPLSLSPLVERLGLRLQRSGRSFDTWADPRGAASIEPMPATMPSPPAPTLLPDRLSASACEALRACPYRFYALHMLRLREADELNDEIERRDYGTWLHAVLLRFHEQREVPGSAQAECERLIQVAKEETAAQKLDPADFLPFEDAFAELAPRYVDWLHQRDAEGASWCQGEQERQITPPAWGRVSLFGRIDRMDKLASQGTQGVELIDYKTGNATALREKVKQPIEDTQLAFYAALVLGESEMPLQASYLALGRKIEVVVHPDVTTSAQRLVQGLAADLARIREGRGLAALGEGDICGYCEARGLCRRDHWSAP